MNNTYSPSHFRHIDPYQYPPELAGKILALAETSLKAAGPIHTVEGLARSAMSFFRGEYPLESINFPWGVILPLPWMDEYFDKVGDSFVPRHLDRTVIGKVAVELVAASAEGPMGDATYQCSTLSGSKRGTVQALSIETLIYLDKVLGYLLEDDPYRAMEYLSNAHGTLFHATVEAQEILGIASNNAKVAAAVRHRENHAIRDQAIEYYRQNERNFKSMDAAAEAIAKHIVPMAIRTVRKWIGEEHKARRASVAGHPTSE